MIRGENALERVRIEGKTPVFSIKKPGFCPANALLVLP